MSESDLRDFRERCTKLEAENAKLIQDWGTERTIFVTQSLKLQKENANLREELNQLKEEYGMEPEENQ